MALRQQCHFAPRRNTFKAVKNKVQSVKKHKYTLQMHCSLVTKKMSEGNVKETKLQTYPAKKEENFTKRPLQTRRGRREVRGGRRWWQRRGGGANSPGTSRRRGRPGSLSDLCYTPACAPAWCPGCAHTADHPPQLRRRRAVSAHS